MNIDDAEIICPVCHETTIVNVGGCAATHGAAAKCAFSHHRVLPQIDVLDCEHIVVNHELIDLVRIRAWLRSRTWPPHSPHRTVESLAADMAGWSLDPTGCSRSNHTIWILQLSMSKLSGYGLYPQDGIFEYSGGLPWFKVKVKGEWMPRYVVQHAIVGLPKDAQQMSTVYWSRGDVAIGPYYK